MDQDLIVADDLDASLAGSLEHGADARPADAAASGAAPDVASLQAEIARLKEQRSSDAVLAEMRAEIDRLKADRREPDAPPQTYRMSQADRERFNPQAVERISSDPLGFLEDYEEKVLVPRLMARMQQFANPAISSAADLVTDAFLAKNTKHLPEKMRGEVEREFQTEIADLSSSLLTMPVAQRQAEMKRRLEAATGRVAVKAYETRAQTAPRTLSQGGGGSAPAGRGTPLQQIAEKLGYDEAGAKRYLKSANLTEAEALDALKDIA